MDPYETKLLKISSLIQSSRRFLVNLLTSAVLRVDPNLAFLKAGI